jgi:hypothetical protein
MNSVNISPAETEAKKARADRSLLSPFLPINREGSQTGWAIKYVSGVAATPAHGADVMKCRCPNC